MRIISETFLFTALAVSCFFLGYSYHGKTCTINQEQKHALYQTFYAFYNNGFSEGSQYANDNIGLVRLTQQDVENLL